MLILKDKRERERGNLPRRETCETEKLFLDYWRTYFKSLLFRFIAYMLVYIKTIHFKSKENRIRTITIILKVLPDK